MNDFEKPIIASTVDPIPADLATPFGQSSCADCGKSTTTHLTLGEAIKLFGYGRSTCGTCLLTDHRRTAGA